MARSSSDPTAPRELTGGERGFGLIEVLITIAIVSIAFVAILSAISTMIVAGAQHREITRTEALARNAAEYVKSPGLSYAPCAATYDLAGLGGVPTGYTAAVSAVKVWDGNDPAGFSSTCTTDTGVQRISITVARAGGGTSQTVSVVKRQP
jgi:prepilin-type N-terminal cleavage/methylation domain-containing protein